MIKQHLQPRWDRAGVAFGAMVRCCAGYLLVVALASAQTASPEDEPEADDQSGQHRELPVDATAVKQFVGRVRSVSDGDTIVVETADRLRHRVRLSGIDAPERGSRDLYGQPYGQRARQNLSQLAYRATVRVEWRTYDGFGRVLGRVWLDDVDVGLQQVCAGYAWVFREFVADLAAQELRTYLDCEQAARAERRGLWRDSRPLAPWEWRRNPRTRELEP